MCSERNGFFKIYNGLEEIRPHIVFERGTLMYCVYCGGVCNTREHAPSKTFLIRPFPSELPVVPACSKCNNGFSQDELFTKTIIALYSEYSKSKIYDCDYSRKENREALSAFQTFLATGRFEDVERIERIIVKLAICHAVYELSEGYKSVRWNGYPNRIWWKFKPQMTKDEINDYDGFEDLSDSLLPEVGSRVYDKLRVLEMVLSQADDPEQKIPIRQVVLLWSEIQEGNYRYMCFIKGDSLIVKIVIHEFLYATIIFTPSE